MFRDYFDHVDGQPVLRRAEVKADVLSYWLTNPALVQSKDTGDSGACLYRFDMTSACPTRCNVGILIDNTEYRPGFEELPLCEVVDNLIFGTSEADLDWLHELQAAHDSAASRDEMIDRITALSLNSGREKRHG